MRMVMRTTGSLLVALLGCGDDSANATLLNEQTQPIVYGKDDRFELFEHPDGALRERARSGIVALIPNSRWQRTATGEVRLYSPTLGEAYELCASERFFEQPVASDCTGVLIDRDLVLTAGHCFQQQDCTDYSYAFDYYYRARNELEDIGSSDLYACRRLVVREMEVLRSGARVDFAIIQLDRPVLDRKPVTLRKEPLRDGEPLSVAGTGSGLPIKLDSAAKVVDPRSDTTDYFGLEADTFEGSSGSGVFDADGALCGILVRGGTDYYEDPTLGCYRVLQRAAAVLEDPAKNELGHEQATYAQRAVQALCNSGFPSLALCDIEPSCGDGFCSLDEARASCPADCDICTNDGGVCGAEIDMPSEATDEVKQSARSWESRGGSCSVIPRQRAGAAWLPCLGVALWLTARRRRAAR